MRRAGAAIGKLPPTFRPAIENLSAAEYLRTSYYEKWYAADGNPAVQRQHRANVGHASPPLEHPVLRA
jgi:hypothetical protein